jgi:hypothetical protein
MNKTTRSSVPEQKRIANPLEFNIKYYYMTIKKYCLVTQVEE